MSVNFEIKEKYDIYDLTEIMRILRAPGGCPWDREQTHESIKKNLIEETYEVIEAVNKKDTELLCEELGDVLMQVVFHAEMERENDTFDFDDVADGVCKKLIERHPHVFGDVKADTTGEVLVNWDKIKEKTKHRDTVTSVMNSVPRELPALMRGQKIQKKAAKCGFDWDDISGAFQKLSEEADEVKEALSSDKSEAVFDEIGDLLFSCVNVSRMAGVDAEEALTHATDKFIGRFSGVEKLAAQRNIDMTSAPLEVLDGLWEEVKKNGNQ